MQHFQNSKHPVSDCWCIVINVFASTGGRTIVILCYQTVPKAPENPSVGAATILARTRQRNCSFSALASLHWLLVKSKNPSPRTDSLEWSDHHILKSSILIEHIELSSGLLRP